MESVRKSKARLQNYPILLGKCVPEASAYAKCVGQYMGEVKSKACQAEFEHFKACIQKNAKKMGTKL